MSSLVLTLFGLACQSGAPRALPAADAADSGDLDDACGEVSFALTEAWEKADLPDRDTEDRVAPGVAIGDLDGDGAPDLFMAYGGGSTIFVNDGTGHFTPAEATLDGAPLPGAGAVALADLDADGDLDAYFGRRHAEDLLLYNEGGLRFRATALEDSRHRPWTASFGDLDLDGDLDLFIGTFDAELNPEAIMAGGQRGDGMAVHLQGPDHAFHKLADAIPAASLPSLTLQASLLDADQDGDLDAYIANDFGPYVVPNHLLLNDGTGHFTRAPDCECELPMYAMGAGVGDSDADGLPDLFISNVGRPALLRSQGDGTFYDASLASGAGIPPTPENMTSWGTAFADLTRDGCEDMVITYGRLTDHFDVSTLDNADEDWEDGEVQPDVLLRGDCEGNFTRFDEAGYTDPGRSRAIAVGDLNQDGRPDLVTVGKHFLHTWLASGGCPAVALRLVGEAGNPEGHGARVVSIAGDRRQTRWMLPATTGSSSLAELYFYDADGFDDIEVTWPGGATSHSGPIAPGARIAIAR